jgi:hypothetical protein
MSKTIWKYELEMNQRTAIEIPHSAEILCVQTQFNNPCIWALVDTDNYKEERVFEIFGTGFSIKGDMGVDRKYIGTFQLEGGALVYHLFERL